MQTLPKNIRISPEADAKIDQIVAKTGQSKADVMRAALELGIEDLMLVKKTPMERLKDEVRSAKKAKATADQIEVTGNADLKSLPSPVRSKRNGA